MANTNLHAARRAKNDEFYTQYPDIEKEMLAYWDYDNDVFRGKTILLPADDYEWSNFTKFFALNFDRFGMKKLISTSYSPDGSPGKVFTLERDTNHDGKISHDDMTWEWLKGNGDFRSDEVRALRDEADIIVTNPPFSLFREFLAWIVEAGKKFSIIGNMNAITYKETFPLIRSNEMWLGPTISSGDREFRVPDTYPLEAAGWRVDEDGNKFIRVKGVRWFTNIDHGRRHEPLALMTMEDNLRLNKAFESKVAYDRYDNYDATEVPQTKAIPSDYAGVMGVPISFLDKFCPEQFEIVGITENGDDAPVAAHRIAGHEKYDRPYVAGKRMYSRIFIKHINHTN